MTMCQRPVGNPCDNLIDDSRFCGGIGGGIGQDWSNYSAQSGVLETESATPNAEAEGIRPSEQEVDMDLAEFYTLLQEPKEVLQQGFPELAREPSNLGHNGDALIMEYPQNEVSPAILEDLSILESSNYGHAETIDYDRPRTDNGSVLATECSVVFEPYGCYNNVSNSAHFNASSWSHGRETNGGTSNVIEISDNEEDDDEVGIIGEKRKLPSSFINHESKPEKKATESTTFTEKARAWWYAPQEQPNAGGKNGGGSETLDTDDDDSDQKDEKGQNTRRYYPTSSTEPRIQEDRNLRTILQRMITVDEKEEASPDEGLMTIPLLKHQRIALAWMEKSENRVECSGGILADDQGLGKTVSTIALILKARAPISKLNLANSDTALAESEPVDLEDDDAEKDLDDSLLSDSSQKVDDRKSSVGRGRRAGGTLVICPTSVLRQWAHEIKAKVTLAANLSILVYHGSNRTRNPDDLAKYDVVLTTYPIVSMEVPKQPLPEERDEDRRNFEDYGVPPFRGFTKAKKAKSKKKLAEEKSLLEAGPLAKVSWFRVVLDEAQSIKNSRTQVARACWGLRAKKRWCLSGTPIQNAIDDLYSYFRFLRFDPLDTYKSFRSEVKDPITRNPIVGYKKLQLILQVVMLRRTKATLIDGQPIVCLPPRYVKLEQADFSEEEREFYSNLELESRRQFQVYAEEGTLQSNYVNILYMLLRLRQACDHPLLVKQTAMESTEFDNVESVKKLPLAQRVELQNTLERNRSICTLCADVPEEAVISCCGHVFCRQCVSEKLATSDDTECPFPKCTVQLNTSLIYTLAALTNCNLGIESSNANCFTKGGRKKKSQSSTDAKTWKSSSKIDAVMRIVNDMRKKTASTVKEEGGDQARVEPPEKAIVFSQWTSMLDLLEPQLRKAGVRFTRLDGTMSVMERDNAVSEFNTNPEVVVMIMSLKAASLGLNMVAACHVLLLDVWWNPTTEDQAIDRAHRIGQTRPVHVSRFTVRNTIEDRILALQERKKQMVSSAFGENEGNSQKSRLTMEDLRFLFSG